MNCFALVRFETMAQYDDFVARTSADEELGRFERQLHGLMTKPIYNLYSKLCQRGAVG